MHLMSGDKTYILSREDSKCMSLEGNIMSRLSDEMEGMADTIKKNF